jgi:hypothetical protein
VLTISRKGKTMPSVVRRDRSIHQVRAENEGQLTLGQLRELVQLAAGIPARASVRFGTDREPSSYARSVLIDYEGELESDE